MTNRTFCTKPSYCNVSNFRRRPMMTSLLQGFAAIVILSQVASGDPSSKNGAPNNHIPDQLAMAAEHRIGLHGPPANYGPPPPGFNGPAPPPPQPYGPPGGPVGSPSGTEEAWPVQGQHDMPQIKILQVQCEKSHMRVNVEFDRPFYGMIFSKGHYSDPQCVHLAPGSGHLSATFDIYLNACGMTSSANGNGLYGPAPSGTFVENTLIIQYDPLVQEVWDQARKLRCTWYDFYEKSVTFRPFQVDMLHAVTANFLGDNLQCWMQIQVGKGPWASEVSGIVKIGQTMTMVLAIKDDENKFDMLVRNCVAHDGKRAPIQLVDAYGCVTRPKIMSRFHKIKNFGASASVVSYAYFQAFKFPDSMNVHFQCVIQVCRFQCPEPKCSGEEVYGPPGPGGPPHSAPHGLPHGDPRHPHGAYSENSDVVSGTPLHKPGDDHEPHIAASAPKAQQALPPNVQPTAHGPPMPPPPPPGYKKPLLLPGPLPAQPSHVMLPPGLPHSGYSNVKREGVVADDDQDDVDDEEEEEEPSLAALVGMGNPRALDLDKNDQRQQRQRSKRSPMENDNDSHSFVVQFSTHKVYKRATQEMVDVDTARTIQVVAPGDVAFSLGGQAEASKESVVVESTSTFDHDGICMSVSSFVGGLVVILLLLVVSLLVAAFLFVRVRSIHSKTAAFASGFDTADYLKQSS